DHPWTLHPSLRSIAALLCLAILSTALALTLYFRLIRTLGAVGASSQAFLRVPIGVALGAAFLDEPLAPTTAIGLVLVMGGVAAMTVPSARATAPRRRSECKTPQRQTARRALGGPPRLLRDAGAGAAHFLGQVLELRQAVLDVELRLLVVDVDGRLI